MLCSRGVTKTIVLKSPDSDKVREVIVTSVLLPKSENENNRTVSLVRSGRISGEDLGLIMEKRTCKRRLDHLSLEEKIMRKKLKNREAAQTSRDRKKARLEELETSVVQLQTENESLHEEVRSLKDERDSLLRENARLTEEESKPLEEDMVGTKTESLEPCRSCFSDTDYSLSTNKGDQVTHSTSTFTDNNKPAPKFPKLDINLAQSFLENNLETPEVTEIPVASLNLIKPSSETKGSIESSMGLTNNENELIENQKEESIHLLNSQSEVMDVDGADIILDEGLDCVVNEEEVETTEFEDESSKSAVPSIVLTETMDTIDLTSEEDGIFCPNLLKPKDILEESSSDHGYESYDSPISEPEELVNLFPELW